MFTIKVHISNTYTRQVKNASPGRTETRTKRLAEPTVDSLAEKRRLSSRGERAWSKERTD